MGQSQQLVKARASERVGFEVRKRIEDLIRRLGPQPTVEAASAALE